MVDDEHERRRAALAQLAHHERLAGGVERRKRLVEQHDRRARRAQEDLRDQVELCALAARERAAVVVVLAQQRLVQLVGLAAKPQRHRALGRARRERRLVGGAAGLLGRRQRVHEPLDRPRVQRAVLPLRHGHQLAARHHHLRRRALGQLDVDWHVPRRAAAAATAAAAVAAARAENGEERRLAGAVGADDRVDGGRTQRQAVDAHRGGAARERDRQPQLGLGRGALRALEAAHHRLAARAPLVEEVGEAVEALRVARELRELCLVARAHQHRLHEVLDDARVDPDVDDGDVAHLQQVGDRALDHRVEDVLPVQPADPVAQRAERVELPREPVDLPRQLAPPAARERRRARRRDQPRVLRVVRLDARAHRQHLLLLAPQRLDALRQPGHQLGLERVDAERKRQHEQRGARVLGDDRREERQLRQREEAPLDDVERRVDHLPQRRRVAVDRQVGRRRRRERAAVG